MSAINAQITKYINDVDKYVTGQIKNTKLMTKWVTEHTLCLRIWIEAAKDDYWLPSESITQGPTNY